jgi:hypothetical protein
MILSEVGFGLKHNEYLGYIFSEENYSPYSVHDNLIQLVWLTEMPEDGLKEQIPGRDISYGRRKMDLIRTVLGQLCFWRSWDSSGAQIEVEDQDILTLGDIQTAFDNLNSVFRILEPRIEFDFTNYLKSIVWNTPYLVELR